MDISDAGIGVIYVAGHRGLIGSAIVRALDRAGFRNLILRTRQQLDLRNQQAADLFFQEHRPQYVFLAAAQVGGILANSTRPADFIRDNLQIQTNAIDAAWRHGARKLLFLGSSCIYPKFAAQPIHEEELLAGPLEPTNDAYAIAKIAGIRMARTYREQYGFSAISLMPTNLYGPGDDFDFQTAHGMPALIRRFHEAKELDASQVTVWGTGTPRREFLHADDLAEAALLLMDRYDAPEIINVGAGNDVTIRNLALLIQRVVGYRGAIVFDPAKPDGTPRKLLDSSRIRAVGWQPRISLEEGIRTTYEWYVEQLGAAAAPALPRQ